MNSMTGYGKANYNGKKMAIVVDVSSLNSRYLEYFIRTPRPLISLEPKIKELVGEKVARGKISVVVSYEDYGVGLDKVVFNHRLAEQVHRELSALKKKHRLAGDIELGHLLSVPDIFHVEKSEDIERVIWPRLKKVISAAIKEMLTMRRREGANMKKDLALRLKLLSDKIREVEVLAADNVSIYHEKLKKRLGDFMPATQIDGVRLEQEVAFMAEKSDITEECIRFKSHLTQFRSNLARAGSVGKSLNFILQELHREVNTIGAKSANTEISHYVVEIKDEIEKMREQVQNIE